MALWAILYQIHIILVRIYFETSVCVEIEGTLKSYSAFLKYAPLTKHVPGTLRAKLRQANNAGPLTFVMAEEGKTCDGAERS